MNSKKRGHIPLFSVFQTEHAVLASIVLVIAFILVTIFPILLPLILVTAIVLGIITLLAIIAGLIDMNREALEYHTIHYIEL